WCVSHQLNTRSHDSTQRRATRETRDAEHEAERDGEHAANNRHARRIDQADEDCSTEAILRTEGNARRVSDLEVRRLPQEIEAEAEPALIEIRLRVARQPPKDGRHDAKDRGLP